MEVVAEPGQVQGDLIGDLGRAYPADRGVEIPAGPFFDCVRSGQTSKRQRQNLS